MNGVQFYCEEVYRRNDSSRTMRVRRQNFAGKFKRRDGMFDALGISLRRTPR